MGFKCGIVGLPNVGKSTLFNALTEATVEAANYPFCTIAPNVGIVPVPDPRIAQLAEIVRPSRLVPTTIEFVDIAGLVKGASQGEGLGNQFLAHIREVDAIAHVVRAFEDDLVTHVEGHVDPLRDIEVINTELALADLDTVDKALHKAGKTAKTGDKESLRLRETLQQVHDQLNQGVPVRNQRLADAQREWLKPLFLLTAKPVLYIANVAENGFTDNPLLETLQQHTAKENTQCIALCAAMEAEIVQLDSEERQLFLEDLGFAESGLNRVIIAGYELLRLRTFFTAGPMEVKAWTITHGATAPQAAGVIHTDFEKGFIRAETIACKDYIAFQGEQGAREAGKQRLEGRDYLVQDGDVMHFRFNV